MANYQILFSGEVAEQASVDRVRDNLARELGLDDRKAKQLFSGRTVVIRSRLDQDQAQAWQDKLAQFGAICRIKDLSPKEDKASFRDDRAASDYTLRDITAAHAECPRCGHLQLDSTNCARCGVDLEEAYKLKRKEDLLIEKKIRELRSKREQQNQPGLEPEYAATGTDAEVKPKKGMLSWFRK